MKLSIHQAKLLTALFALSATMLLCLSTALAQVGTTTTSTVVSLETLLSGSVGVYDAFSNMTILVGVSAAINLLINVTKFGPVATFIKIKGWKWLRPILALIAGAMAGVVGGLAAGRGGTSLAIYVVGGLMTGGGAIAIHELIAVVKGDRS